MTDHPTSSGAPAPNSAPGPQPSAYGSGEPSPYTPAPSYNSTPYGPPQPPSWPPTPGSPHGHPTPATPAAQQPLPPTHPQHPTATGAGHPAPTTPWNPQHPASANQQPPATPGAHQPAPTAAIPGPQHQAAANQHLPATPNPQHPSPGGQYPPATPGPQHAAAYPTGPASPQPFQSPQQTPYSPSSAPFPGQAAAPPPGPQSPYPIPPSGPQPPYPPAAPHQAGATFNPGYPLTAPPTPPHPIPGDTLVPPPPPHGTPPVPGQPQQPQSQPYHAAHQGDAQPYATQPPQAPPRRSKGLTALLIAGAVVVLLAVGTGTAWFVAGMGDTGTSASGGGGSAEWTVPLANADTMDFTSGLAYGSWLTDKVVIRVQRDGVLAYDLASGKRAWGIPAPGQQVCGATPDLSGGKAAIAYGSTHLCDHLAGIDTATGKLTWKTKIPAEKSRLANSLDVPRIMTTKDIAIVQLNDVMSGYRLSDGRKQWTISLDDGCHLKDTNAAPTQVVALVDCAFTKGTGVATFDPATGRRVARFPIGEISLMSTVLSADPIVVQREESGDKSLFTVFDKSGKTAEFTSGKVDMLAMNTVAFIRGMFEQHRYAVHGDRLYLATFPENVKGKLRSGNKALAFDLKTGKQLWESSGTKDTMLTYVRADDQGLLALETGDRRDLPPRLVRLNAATGKAEEIATLPQQYGTEAEHARVFERNGVVIIVPWTSVTSKYAVTYVNTKEN